MLKKRHEHKYLISELEYFVLVNRLKKSLKRDQNSINNSYYVTSIYFDNVYNQAYKDKVNGEAIRHKYRIRFYNNNLSILKLERKSKINQITSKISVPLKIEELKKIYHKDYSFLLSKELRIYHEFYQQLQHGLLKPKVVVQYKREAFVHSVGDLRVTFDHDVKTANNQLDVFKKLYFIDAIDSQYTIMEIKFNGVLPQFIRTIIQSGHTAQAASSKYVFSRKYNAAF